MSKTRNPEGYFYFLDFSGIYLSIYLSIYIWHFKKEKSLKMIRPSKTLQNSKIDAGIIWVY